PPDTETYVPPGHLSSDPQDPLSSVHTKGVISGELRHLLTHQNGVLRSPDAVERFRDADAERDQDEISWARIGGKVPLGTPRVLKILDSLAAVIRTADVPAWAMCWSRLGREDWAEVMTKLHQQKCIVVEPA
ncbi:hypothetical protein, partial [Streptomyces sp. NPDC005732]|uniref:hypothetical protein n=1 Tax=Streptomyces sp. NPDC005732 TaxID=3157057 RepID=UPI0033C94909